MASACCLLRGRVFAAQENRARSTYWYVCFTRQKYIYIRACVTAVLSDASGCELVVAGLHPDGFKGLMLGQKRCQSTWKDSSHCNTISPCRYIF